MRKIFISIILSLFVFFGYGQTTTYTSSGTWVCPAGVTTAYVECWGAGGAGGGSRAVANSAGGGGGGGSYSMAAVTVVPGNSYNVVVGTGGVGVANAAGGNGGNSSFNGTSVVANGGAGGSRGNSGAGGAGGALGTGTTVYTGGAGAAGASGTASGGGGGGAGSLGNGGAASGSTPGTGTTSNGGNGGTGRTTGNTGNVGLVYGGGGSGAYGGASATAYAGGNGANGLVVVSTTPPVVYCIPSGSSSSYFIDDFSTTGGLTNITNNNTGYSATGYGNFTGLTVTQVLGSTVNFSITNDGGSNTYGFSIWVDWNQDSDFADAGEQVFVTSSYATSASGSFTVPMTATIGCTRMRVTAHYTNSAPSNPCLTSASNEFEDYTFCVNALSACAGSPAPGNTVSSVNPACPSVSFTLSTSNALPFSGITYQWQSSPDNITWSNIVGATSSTYTGTQASDTYYRCLVTCTNSGLSTYSTALLQTTSPFTSCYCTSSATSTSDMDITNILFGSINNTSATVSLTGSQGTATGTAGMYSDWRASAVPIPSFMQGSTNAFSVTIGGTAYSHRVVVYIDFNHNGSLADAGENFDIFAYANPSLPNTTSSSITIPISALTGNTLMRVVCVESSTANPCGTYTWGETEDYIINITAASPCSGTPSGGTAAASVTNGCPGYTSLLSVSGSTIATGLTYQWQSAPAAAGPWTNIAGATSELYTATVSANTYYRRITTCTSSGMSGNSVEVLASIINVTNDDCAGAITLTVNPDELCGTVTSGSTMCATNSGIAACVGSGADDDVWFKFVATNTSVIVSLLNITGTSTDLVHEIFSGACGSLTSIACSDPNSSQWSGFTIGQTYYIRVYTYSTGYNASFDICLGTPPPPPSNDDPCGAIALSVNTGSCSYQTAVLNTSTTATSGIPAPGCGSLGPDIWFTAVVPASGRLIVDLSPNGGPTDFDMAWYTATGCSGTFTLIECDDYDSQSGSMSMICRTGALCTVPGDCQQNATLTPGQTIYIRVWEYGGGSYGPFDICAYEPAAPGAASTCATATNIASLPFTQTGNTTCCRANSVTAAQGCASSYQDGEDFLYTYTPAANQTIDISLTGTLSYTGIFVTDRCPTLGGAVCVGSSTSSSGNPLLCGLNLVGGTTYYIMVDTDPTPNCTPFNISISASSAPSCGLNYTASTIGFGPDLNAGTDIALPVDDRFSSSYIPIGFPFCFDGFQHTQLLVSSNGYVIFDPIGCSSNLPSANASPGASSGWDITTDVPNTTNAPRNCIMFPFQDVYPSLGGTIKYQTLGTTPNRRFVLTFDNVPYYSCTSMLFTGQLKLFETSNDIEMHITSKVICSTWNEGGAILGLHNYNGSLSVVPAGYNYASTWTATNQAWRFTCNCAGCIVLPVELVEFTGEKISSNVNYLKWATATETNNAWFELERKSESNEFEMIAKVDGAGNSNEYIKYSYTDNEAPEGPAYYRLKQIDKDGQFAYSETIVVGDVSDLADISAAYPNPANNELKMKINSDGAELRVVLVNSGGQEFVLGEGVSVMGYSELTFNVGSIPPGVYYLKVGSMKNESYFKEKIVIQR